MVKTKQLSLSYILFWVIAILFPFGQLVRIEYQELTILLQDVLVFGSFLLVLPKLKKTSTVESISWFLLYLLLSYSLSQIMFFGQNTTGILYLLRLTGYLFFPFFVSNLVTEGRLSKDYIFTTALVMLGFGGLFGWVQYLLYPDLRFLYHLGWDDHYYRLSGTFLDPGFTSILLVFGFGLSLIKYFQSRNKKLFLLPLFFTVTLAFTFSRAGYLAFAGALVAVAFFRKNITLPLLFLALFVITVLFLPRPGGEGVKLQRTASVGSRLDNYRETFEVIKKSPLFGIGYNNMCDARRLFLGDIATASHGCSGSDSSLMLLTATGGALGIMVFLSLAKDWWKSLQSGMYKETAIVMSVALAIHSLFVNSIFYPWVMVVVGIILGLGLVGESDA